MMATPPARGGPILQDNVKETQIHEIPLDANLTGGNTTLEPKTATLKIADEMSQSQVDPPVADTNGEVKATVNGHRSEEAMSNGVNGTNEHNPVSGKEPIPQDAPAESSTTEKVDSGPTDPSPSQEEPKPASNGQTAPASATEEPQQPPSPKKEGDRDMSPAAASLETEVKPRPPTQAEPTATPSTEPPAEETKVDPEEQQPKADQEMADAPPLSPPNKVPREREDDAGEEPAAKRTKTEDGSQGDAQFKVPELPASAAPVADSEASASRLTPYRSKFIIRTIQSLKRSHDSRFYRMPVDPVKLNIPNYPTIVKQPMDLQTVDEKLKKNQYTTLDEVVADFKLMVNNSVIFNGPEHIVSTEGHNLFKAVERHLSKLPGPDEVELTAAQKKAKKISTPGVKSQPPRESRVAASQKAAAPPSATSPTTFALGPEGLPLIRRDSSTADGRPKRSIHPPKNRDFPYSAKPKKKKYQWELKFCQEVVDELHKPKYYNVAAAFYYPVDPVALNIPTYHNIIKKPMDLQTIQSKLNAGSYENAREFEMDVRQIFKNCFKFNIPGDPTHNCGKRLEEVFQHKWNQKSRWLEAHEPSSGHQSAGSSDNESEEEEEEESEVDQEQEKLHLLQKQIAEMSKQVTAITQKKRKTPPAPAKKGSGAKAKPAKKDTKKATGKKDKKAGGPKAKPEKQRWVTYQEKQLISNGIESLSEKRLREAYKLIQNNVPSVKGSGDNEIELDMDDLPNNVLLLLLNFVKKHAPAALEVDNPAAEPVPTIAPSKPKKNKPMSKYEQEAKINMLEGSIKNFQGGPGHTSDPAQVESSDDEEDSEESEEE